MSKVISVDFDGTLCENAYPLIGEPRLSVINALKARQASGDKLILNTCREGELLDKAVAWCWNYHKLKFDAINENLSERIEQYGGDCRKISADEYWDDKNVMVQERSPSKAMEDVGSLSFIEDKPGKSSDIKWSIHEYIAPSLDRIAKVSYEGNRKYGEGNWSDVSKREMITHAIRHLCFELSRMEGCWIPEVGDDHLAHAACRVMMAIALEERGKSNAGRMDA